MALFTDSNVVTLDDLLEFESSLVQISSTHNIDVSTKINLAVSGIGDKVLLWLLQVRASDPQWLNRRILGLSTVVVTPTLHRWLCFEALSFVFAEAYNVQLNTRFQAKWTEYKQQSSNASDMVFMSGLGIVYNPLPRPEAPLVSVQTGTFPAQALFIQTSWVDKFGNQSAPSPVNGVILQAPSSVSVAMAPNPVTAPSSAIGWNVYASTTADSLVLQNSTPTPTGATWQLPANGLVSGSAPTDGQQPNFYVTLSRQIQRG